MDCVTTDDDGRRRTTTNDDIAIADFIASHRTREDDVTYDTRRFASIQRIHSFIHSHTAHHRGHAGAGFGLGLQRHNRTTRDDRTVREFDAESA